MGDSADNFPGCPGVGEKTAAKLINEFESVENLIANTDKLKGKQKEKVEGAIEDIKISKFLATPCRYLFLHLLYHALQDDLRAPFDAHGMLPYRYFSKCYPAPSVSALYPIIIHARTLD